MLCERSEVEQKAFWSACEAEKCLLPKDTPELKSLTDKLCNLDAKVKGNGPLEDAVTLGWAKIKQQKQRGGDAGVKDSMEAAIALKGDLDAIDADCACLIELKQAKARRRAKESAGSAA